MPAVGLGRVLRGLLLAAVLAGCTIVDPSPSTSVAPPQVNEPLVGCVAIEAPECQFVARRIVAALPEGRRMPFSVLISLNRCPNDVPCPFSLGARNGRALVEYVNGFEPIQVSLAGPPAEPQIAVDEGLAWSGPMFPSSQRGDKRGPILFEVGHCGLTHVVDFDGSFWVIVGQVGESVPALINQEQGTITLTGPNTAIYRGTEDAEVSLARFPGAKQFFLCD
jgi:hypothetical protein